MSRHPTSVESPTPQTAPTNPRANPPAAPPPSATGRTGDGRFAKGNAGGPGNPFARRVAALRRALLAGVTAEDIEEVLAALLIKAKCGDLAAIKLLLSYTIGKPGPAVDPDTLEQQEWQLHQQAAVTPAAMEDLLGSLPAATANTMVQIAWPCAAHQHLQPIIQGLRAAEAAPPPAPPTPSAAPDGPPAGLQQDRPRPPSANGGIGTPSQTRPAQSPRRKSSLPPKPSPDDPEYEAKWHRRIEAILFGDEGDPPDNKPG